MEVDKGQNAPPYKFRINEKVDNAIKDIINVKCCVKITLIELFPLNIDVNVNCRSLKDKISDLVWRATHGHETSAKIKASNGKFK